MTKTANGAVRTSINIILISHSGVPGSITGQPHEACGRQVFTHYLIPPPFSASLTHCSYDKDKVAKVGILPKSNARSEIGDHWLDMYFREWLQGGTQAASDRSVCGFHYTAVD